MGPDARLSFASMPGVILRLATPRSTLCHALHTCALLMTLVSATLPGHAIAETADASHPNPPEQGSGYPRHGLVAAMSNLRASPSTQSEVVAVAKVGMPVEILTETERWYRVKSEEGLQAWIHKSLVRIEPAPPKMLPTMPETAVQPDVKERSSAPTVIAQASTTPDESQPEHPADAQNLGFPFSVFGDTPLIPVESTGVSWSIDAILAHVQGLSIYVIPALVLLLILSLTLQLRAARQLRQAMQELGEIFDIVEEIYANGLLAPTSSRGAIRTAIAKGAAAAQVESPAIEFSSVERAALEAMSHQREVQEGELAKILAEKGFGGVLVKAVVGNIIRKTRATGLPWVEVRYIQGRYRYQLRSEGVSSPSEG